MLRSSSFCLISLVSLAPALHAGVANSVIFDNYDSVFPNSNYQRNVDIVSYDPGTAGSNGFISTRAGAVHGSDFGAISFTSGYQGLLQGRISYFATNSTNTFDLTQGGLDTFALTFWNVDADFAIQMIATDDQGRTGTTSLQTVQDMQTQVISLSMITDFDNPGIDFSRITSFSIELNVPSDDSEGTRSLDFALTRLTIVPAPATLPMLGMGCMFAARRRRD